MKSLIGAHIEFTNRIEEAEGYAEGKMRATISNIYQDKKGETPEDDVWVIDFNFTEYDDFNRQFESSNYYDSRGIPNKTAREKGFYKTLDRYHFGSPELYPFESYFTILDEGSKELRQRFEACKETSYVRWLENLVTEHEGKGTKTR